MFGWLKKPDEALEVSDRRLDRDIGAETHRAQSIAKRIEAMLAEVNVAEQVLATPEEAS